VTLSPRALDKLDQRKTKVTSWYLDMTMLRNYWGSDRVYHHTAPINMTYALFEALRVILEEGLPRRITRHEHNHRMLRAGLEAMGLGYVPQHTLTTLNAVYIPDGVDDLTVRKKLLQEYNIEIGAGLGPFKGKVWRFGLMGSSSTKQNVMLVLAALGEILYQLGKLSDPGVGLAAASDMQTVA
jgi:alanine-glyoxylate transaminase / serine-glyoxylate transaminase / serine-pyruvate transaminase